MSNPKWHDADLSAIDLRTITSLEWTAVKAEVNRRASVARKALLRRLWRRLWMRLRPVWRERAPEVRTIEACCSAPTPISAICRVRSQTQPTIT